MTGCQGEFFIEQGVLKRYTGNAAIVFVPDGVTKIGYRAFYENRYLKHIHLPDTVVRIDSMAFFGCEKLQEVQLQRGICEIGYSAFENCTDLQKIKLPEGLTILERFVFRNCEMLLEIEFPDSLSVVGRDAFSETAWLNRYPDGVVYAGRLVLFTKGIMEEANIRTGTVKICADAFRDCYRLTIVRLPEGLVELEDRAFRNCRKLKEITIPHTVKRIGSRVFQECTQIKVELLGEHVQIGQLCFEDHAVVHITNMDPSCLPSNVRQSAVLKFTEDVCNHLELDTSFLQLFYQYMRSHRTSLYPLAVEYGTVLQVMLQEQMISQEGVELLLEKMLQSGKTEAIAALMRYQQSICVPELLEESGSWDELELDWEESIEKTEEERKQEWGVKKNPDGTATLLSYHGSDKELVVPDFLDNMQITAIAPAACSPKRYGIKRETAEKRLRICTITVKEGITRIGNHVFADCINVRQIILPESLVEIGYEAFCNCTSLTSLTIPSSVKRIGRAAFAGCYQLKKIEIPAGVQVAEDAFVGCAGVPERIAVEP